MAKKGGKPSLLPLVPDDIEVHVPLQALLLADSFTTKFRPITLEKPKVLLPLVNVPLIDYTLEWLASAGVEECFVFCCAHAAQVTSHLTKAKWRSQPNFAVTPIESHDCVSAGDALRLIEQRGVIRGDFVLVSGDTVSNMSLKEVVKEHQERRKKDKLAVMTMVVKRAKPSPSTYQTRLGNDELLLAIDPQSKQLLHYDPGRESGGRDNHQHQSNQRHVKLERSALNDRPSVQLCTNLQDCHIDICSPEVLTLFTDNFDYQQIRRDFVRGLLSDEIMGNKIFTYEIGREYAARVENLRAYDVVSQDVIHRWTYPMVPDIPFGADTSGMRFERCNVYKATGVSLSRTSTVGENSVVGQGTEIGEGTSIRRSVIGRGCRIGKNVSIEGCHIWDNVTIEDDAQLKYSIVCDGAAVKAGAILKPGVVLSFKVVIGPKFIVPAYSKISMMPQPTEEDSSDEELEYADAASGRAESPRSPFLEDGDSRNGSAAEDEEEVDESGNWDPDEVGETGAGYRWSIRDGTQEEDWRHSVAPIPAEKIRELVAAEEEGETEEADNDIGAAARDTPAGPGVEDEEELSGDEDDDFEKEVEGTFLRLAEGVSGVQQEHVVIEVNSLKLAYNKTFADCAGAMFKALMSLALGLPYTSAKELLANTKDVVIKWGSLLQKFLKGSDDEHEILLTFEEVCLESHKEFAPLFSQILQEMYDKDIISEDAIMAWAKEKQDADDNDKVFVKQSEPFIQWLKEAPEEDDDDEDE
ncbi:hypothetical protein M758_11G136100 [Ceratodon purpureus]|nr:hypothetical protein M758_11G136100 [Ceratodon purpureus]